jgi:hypothetical protein
LCGKNNQIISKKNNQDKVFGKNNQNNNQENNQADYFYRTGPKSLASASRITGDDMRPFSKLAKISSRNFE